MHCRVRYEQIIGKQGVDEILVEGERETREGREGGGLGDNGLEYKGKGDDHSYVGGVEEKVGEVGGTGERLLDLTHTWYSCSFISRLAGMRRENAQEANAGQRRNGGTGNLSNDTEQRSTADTSHAVDRPPSAPLPPLPTQRPAFLPPHRSSPREPTSPPPPLRQAQTSALILQSPCFAE